MDSKVEPTAPPPPDTTATPPQPPQQQPPPTPTPTLPQSSSTPPPEIPPPPSTNPNPITPNPNPNPNQNPQPSTPIPPPQQQQQQQSTFQQSQIRDPLNRIRPPNPYSQFPSSSTTTSTTPTSIPTTTNTSSSSSLMSSPSIAGSSMQRAGVAIGVPAHHTRAPSPQASHFSSFGSSTLNPSLNQSFGVMGRSSVNFPDSISGSNPNQMKSSIQGMQNTGMMGSFNSGSQMRPSAVPSHIQQRNVQPPMRPQAPQNNQSLATQKFQGQGVLRGSMGTVGSASSSSPAGMQPHTQQWMQSSAPGKQMIPSSLPSPSYRQQMKQPSMQQRSHLPPQHHHPSPTVSHQQMPSASPQQQHQQQQQQQQQQQSQQQPSQSNQLQEHNGQQYPPPRVHQLSPHQPPVMRNTGSGNQKSPIMVNSGPQNTTCADPGECTNQIVSKRSIHELITQIDPSEKFDPEVEDILVDIADDFVESITTFACSLAKHRKSNVLEAKDILLHLERNWNMSLPGFGGDEIKNYKKPFTNDIHRERLAAVKKSMVGSDAAGYTKNSVGVATGNAKGHTAKMPPPTGSPKAREVP